LTFARDPYAASAGDPVQAPAHAEAAERKRQPAELKTARQSGLLVQGPQVSLRNGERGWSVACEVTSPGRWDRTPIITLTAITLPADTV
jgi:hypothetical protein